MAEVEKPLHVRVAEALGWHRIKGPLASILADSGLRYSGYSPGPFVIGSDAVDIPRYDTDWSATGPLIERFSLSVRRSFRPLRPGDPWIAWAGASDCGSQELVAHAATPLLAVCNLILALAEAGKLPK